MDFNAATAAAAAVAVYIHVYITNKTIQSTNKYVYL